MSYNTFKTCVRIYSKRTKMLHYDFKGCETLEHIITNWLLDPDNSIEKKNLKNMIVFFYQIDDKEENMRCGKLSFKLSRTGTIKFEKEMALLFFAAECNCCGDLTLSGLFEIHQFESSYDFIDEKVRNNFKLCIANPFEISFHGYIFDSNYKKRLNESEKIN